MDAEYYIETLTRPGDLVLDPMMGTGTYPIAALELGRKVIGIEIDFATFETAKARLDTRLVELLI